MVILPAVPSLPKGDLGRFNNVKSPTSPSLKFIKPLFRIR
jgi:hypothetical protein